MIRYKNLIIEHIVIEDLQSCYDNGILIEAKVFDVIKQHLKSGVAIATLISALTALDYTESAAKQMVDSANVELTIQREVNTPEEVSDYIKENLEEFVHLLVNDQDFFNKIQDIYKSDSDNVIQFGIVDTRLQYGKYLLRIVDKKNDYVTFNKNRRKLSSFEIDSSGTVTINNSDELRKLRSMYPKKRGYRHIATFASSGGGSSREQKLLSVLNDILSSSSWSVINKKYSEKDDSNVADRINSFDDIMDALEESPSEFIEFILGRGNQDALQKVLQIYSDNEQEMNSYLEEKILNLTSGMVFIYGEDGNKVSPQRISNFEDLEKVKEMYPEDGGFTHEVEFMGGRDLESSSYIMLYKKYQRSK